MASSLTDNSLIINGTQEITGVSTVLNGTDTEIITGKAFIDFLVEEGIWNPPVSLVVSGDWGNTQFINKSVDITGLTFTVTYADETSSVMHPYYIDISPSTWSSTVGTQTATFSYSNSGTTVSCTKTADVQDFQGFAVSFPSYINLNIYEDGAYIKFYFYDGTDSIYENNQIANLNGATIDNVLSIELRSRDGSYEGVTLEPLSNFVFSGGISIDESYRFFGSYSGEVGTITLNSDMTLDYLGIFSSS